MHKQTHGRIFARRLRRSVVEMVDVKVNVRRRKHLNWSGVFSDKDMGWYGLSSTQFTVMSCVEMMGMVISTYPRKAVRLAFGCCLKVVQVHPQMFDVPFKSYQVIRSSGRQLQNIYSDSFETRHAAIRLLGMHFSLIGYPVRGCVIAPVASCSAAICSNQVPSTSDEESRLYWDLPRLSTIPTKSGTIVFKDEKKSLWLMTIMV